MYKETQMVRELCVFVTIHSICCTYTNFIHVLFVGSGVNIGNFVTHVKSMHPEELAFSDFYEESSVPLTLASSSMTFSSPSGPSAGGLGPTKKQKLRHTIEGSFSNASAKANRSLKKSVTDAIVETSFILLVQCIQY